MDSSCKRDWFAKAVLAAAVLNLSECLQPYPQVVASDTGPGIVVAAPKEVAQSPASETETVTETDQPARKVEAGEADAPKQDGDAKPDADGATDDTSKATSEELKLLALKESIANELRRDASVCGAIFGDVTAESLEITVLLEDSAKKQPSVEDLTAKIRRLSGERTIELEAKPWGAAARLKQLQMKSDESNLTDIKLTNLFLQGLVPNKLVCQVGGSAKDLDSQDALVEAITGLVVKEFESPAGKPNSVEVSLQVAFDSAPLLKAIQESLAQNIDLVGLRVNKVIPSKEPATSGRKLVLEGDSPLPHSDDVKLVELVGSLLPTVAPKWKNKLEVQTPVLADRVPDTAIVLVSVQKVLMSSSKWKGCELTQIVAGLPNQEGKLTWKLKGKAAQPEQEVELIDLCQEVVLKESPWWKRAKDRLSIVSEMEVTFDTVPLLKAIQESLVQSVDLTGLRVKQITARKDPQTFNWILKCEGDSPLPGGDDVKLVNHVNSLFPTIYPKLKDKFEVQTPVLADRVPDATIVLVRVQKMLKSSAEWKGCELTQIVAGAPTQEGKLVWTLKGQAINPVREGELIDLCHEAVILENPWWKRAKDRLEIVSDCALDFPPPQPFVAHIQQILKGDPIWRGCQLKKIAVSTTSGNSGRSDNLIITWSLVGEVYHPGQKERLMELVQDEHCRVNPEWKGYAGFQFGEQLKQVPVDPAPVLTALQVKLSQNPGWDGCKLTSLECPACSSSAAGQTQTWQIHGTVAFLCQQVELLELIGETFREVYPGWGKSKPPEIDPNLVKIVHPSAATLLALIQHDMQRMPEFDNCQIGDAVIESGSNGKSSVEHLELRLIGRTTRSAQRDSLVSLDRFASLKKSYGPKVTAVDAPQILPNPSDIELAIRSSGLASMQFEIGLNHYLRCEFAQAKAAFAGAMFDDASNMNYKLWHLAMCLAAKDESLAHDRFYNLMKERRAEFRDGSAAFHSQMQSLERLQGPLRRQLEALERQVLSEVISSQTQARR